MDTTPTPLTDTDIWTAVATVADPEIPVLTLVDMGMISSVRVVHGDRAEVVMTPTFVGCPALDVMKRDLTKALLAAGFTTAEVTVDFETAWTTERMTPEAKQKLETFGIAPPAHIDGELTAEMLDRVRCPHCGSTDTTLRSAFGSTLCRAIRFCFSCKQGFEQFKPV